MEVAYGFRQNHRVRALHWLGKRDAETPPKATVYRKAALEWALATNHMLLTITAALGWSHYYIPEGHGERVAFALWPLLRVAMDQGSDGWSAMMAMLYGLRLNVEVSPDPNHGCHNDVKRTLIDMGWYAHQVLMTLAYNLAHAPWDSGERQRQFEDALDEWFTQHDHTDDLPG